MKPVRFCVVGTGRAGLLHARNLAGRIRRASVTVLCDTDQETLQKAGHELEVSTLLTDYTAAISRDDVDAILVVTPTFLHRDIACLAARHGKHVFLEKPMALDRAECESILAAVEQARIQLQIGFMRRFDAGFRQAKAMIESGELGRVMIIKSTGRGPGGPGTWMYDLRKSNGIIAEVNSHDLDTLRWLTGQEFQQVYAQGRNFKCPDARTEWPDFYDNVVAQFTFDHEAMGIVDGTCPAHYGYDARVEVLGEKGLLQIGQVQEPGLTRVSIDGQVSRPTIKSWRTLFKDAYLAEMEHFVECIIENKSPQVTGDDGLHAVEAVMAVNESIRTGEARPHQPNIPKMIAAKYTQGGGLDISESPIPAIREDELLVRVEATSICGTDVKIVRRGHRKLRDGQTIILGHEFVGTIEEAGSQVSNYPVGTRVGLAPNIGCGHCEMCGRGLMNLCPDYSAFGIDRDGSHAEFVCIPTEAIVQGNVIPLHPDVSPVEAALTEPLSCAVNGIRVAQVSMGDLVLIYGAGPMGLLNLMVALVSGASRILVVDLNESRLEKALLLGASGVWNPHKGAVKQWIMEQTHGRGVDAAITAVPSRHVQSEALDLLAPFGRLCLFAGLPNGESAVELNTNSIHYRNLMVTGMTGGAPQDYRTALKLIESGRVDVRQIISHMLPVCDMDRAYELALSGQGMKIVMAAEKWVDTKDKDGALGSTGSSQERTAQTGAAMQKIP